MSFLNEVDVRLEVPFQLCLLLVLPVRDYNDMAPNFPAFVCRTSADLWYDYVYWQNDGGPRTTRASHREKTLTVGSWQR